MAQTTYFNVSNYISFKDVTEYPGYGSPLVDNGAIGDILTTGGLELLVSQHAVYMRGLEAYPNVILTNPYSVNSFPEDKTIFRSIDFVDYNRDGDLDVFITSGNVLDNYTRSMLFRNNGNNTFTLVSTPQIINFLQSSQDWKDFDNDGDYDLIISGKNLNYGMITKIYRNESGESFSEIFSSVQDTGSVAWWDFDNNGLYDFVVGNSVYTNLDNGSFSFRNKIPAVPGEIAIGDFDMDGDMDLVCGYRVIKNTNGNYEIISSLDGVNAKNSWADYDNDGDLDLLHGSTLYQNAGNDLFNPTAFNWFTNGSLWIDFDGDSDLDIFSKDKVYLNAGSPNSAPGAPLGLLCTVENSNAKFTWNSATDSKTVSPGLTYNLFVGTASNIGDILSPQSVITTGTRKIIDFGNVGLNKQWTVKNLPEGKYYWGVQTIDNTFMPSSFSIGTSFEIKRFNNTQLGYQAGDLASKVHIIDYDNDNDLDALYTRYWNGALFICFQNDGLNAFSQSTLGPTLSTGGMTQSDILDFNKDGSIDLFTSINNSIFDGATRSSNQISLPISGETDWGDFNNDAYEDLAVGSLIILNNLNTSFSVIDTLLSNAKRTWIDFDNDNDLDLLDGEFLYENDNKVFVLRDTVLGGNICQSWCDIDNDGDLDLTANNKIYSNDDGIFNFKLAISQYNLTNAVWADFDNNGYSDLLQLNSETNVLMLLYNQGNFSFLPVELENAKGTYVTTPRGINVGDFDKDGDMDFFLVGIAEPMIINNYSFLFRNNSNKFNSAPSSPQNPVSRLDGFDIVLSWAPAYDQECHGQGLTYNLRVGTTPGGTNIISPMSDKVSGFRRVPEMGNVQCNLGWRIKDLPEGTYYWSVQAIDQAYSGGEWTTEQTFTITRVSANFSADNVCEGTPTHFADLSLCTDGVADAWEWNFGDGSSSTLKNPEHIFPDGATYYVTLVAHHGIFSHSITKSVIVRHAPAADFTAQTVCAGTETSFISTSNLDNITGAVWLWTFGDNKVPSNTAGSLNYLYSSANTYNATLTITASNGCADVIQKPVTVAEIPYTEISINGYPAICKGDTTTLNVKSDNNYLYRWMVEGIPLTGADSNVYMPEFSGNFTVEITNKTGNCKHITSPVHVTVIPNPEKPVIISDNYQTGDCPGANPIKISVDQEVIEYGYPWYRNGQPVSGATLPYLEGYLEEGDYSVQSTLNRCSSISDVFNITYNGVPEKPEIYAIGPNLWYLGCSNTTATQYRWYYNGILIPGADKYYYVANQNLGEYQVSISNSKGCFTRSDIIRIPPTTGTEEIDVFTSLKIFPNPSSGIFTLDMQNQTFGEVNIEVYNTEGKMIMRLKDSKSTENYITRVDLSYLPKGLYMLNINFNNCNKVIKVVTQ